MKTNFKKLSTLLMIFTLILFSVPFNSYAVDADNATIYITADDAYILYVNGVVEGSDNNWRQKEEYRVALYDDYLIAVEAWDEHQIIDGFNMQIVFDDTNIPTVETKTASNWLVTTTPETDWQLPSTTISGWSPVTEIQDSRWTNITGQWVWTPNYVHGNEVFDSKAYFRFDGSNPRPQIIVIGNVYELTSPVYSGSGSITENSAAGYITFEWSDQSLNFSNDYTSTYIAPGTEVKLTAVAKPGYEFVGWRTSLNAPNDPPIANPFTVTVGELTSEISQTAIFKLLPDTSENTTEDTTGTSSETSSETTQPTTQAPTEPQGPQGSIVVNFVDTEGNSIGSSFTFTGTVGTLYQTSSRSIEGYELTETPANASGNFIDGSITVDYVYSDGVIIEEESVALGEANVFNFDSIYDNMTTEEATDEAIILDEATPLADALPQTGQATPELFYGIGGLVSALGLYIKKRK